MIKSTSFVFLFLISLASTAQISNAVFSKNLSQQNRTSANTSNQRTSAANKQRLDSIVSPFRKYVYIYNPAGNVILDSAYQRSSAANPWIPVFRTEYVYDAAGNTTLNAKYYWDDATNVFFPDTKYESTYDANKNQLSEITYSWSSKNNNWFPTRKFENTFGANGQISNKHNYYWAGSVLMDDSYTTYTYNSKNLLADETQYNLANSIQSQKTYTYDTNDNLISTTSSSGGSLTNKYEYTYDTKNNVTLLLESEWNNDMNDWGLVYKMEYEFDSQNNQTELIESDWNTQTNMWEYSYKNVYNYDNSYAATDLIMPEGLDEIFKHKLTGIDSYDFINKDWQLTQKYTPYYKSITTTGIVHANSNASLTAYPNPATDNVIFTNKTNDAATLELFNLQGNLIYKNTIIMNQPVSIDELETGIYLYRVSNTSTGSYNGRLVID